MFATAAELGVGIMAYGPLAHGLPTGTFTPETTFDSTDWRAAGNIFRQPLFSPENFPANLGAVERLKALAARKGVSLPAGARLGARQPAGGGRAHRRGRPSEIEENVAALTVELMPADHAALDAIMQARGRPRAPVRGSVFRHRPVSPSRGGEVA
jgi:aryl-alcohol dehydrogenase-like predicted oxidoreductase